MVEIAARTRLALARESPASHKTRLKSNLLAALIGSILYVYSWLGIVREFPPFVLHIQMVTLLLLSVWWAWKVWHRRSLARSPLALPMVAWVASGVLSAFFSIDQRMSFVAALATLGLVLFFFLVCDLLLAGWKPAIFVNALLILVGLTLIQGLWVTAEWYWRWWGMRVPEYPVFPIPFRLFGVATHPSMLAALLNLALPFAILRLSDARDWSTRALYGLWLLAADVVLFFTKSRGGWIATATILALVLGWMALRPGLLQRGNLGGWFHRTWRLWVTALAYVAVFGALQVMTTLVSPSTFSSNDTLDPGDAYSRWSVWEIAWRDFLAHPLLGSGVGSYGHVFADATATSLRGSVLAHGHNLFLGTLAEQGLVGFLALGVLLFMAGSVMLRAAWSWIWTDGEKGDERQPLLAGVMAALAGMLAHSQVDTPLWVPTLFLSAMGLLALGMYAAGALKPSSGSLSRWTLAVLIAPILLGTVLVRQNSGQELLLDAISRADKGDWVGAAERLKAAIGADPSLVFYYEQRGYADGMLAAPISGRSDTAALQQALDDYAVALLHGPARVTNLLNTAELLDRAGAADEAGSMLERALPRPGGRPLPAILLAERYAQSGRTGEAEALLRMALRIDPSVRETGAWRSNSLVRSQELQAPLEVDPISRLDQDARRALRDGRAREALAMLGAVPTSNAAPVIWLDRADAHLALGQLRQAAYALHLVQEIRADRGARFALTKAAYLLAMGEREKAVAVLEQVARPGITETNYSVAVYARIGLPGALLPRLAMLERNSDDLAVFRQLAQLYAEDGRIQDARWVDEQASLLSDLLGPDASR